MVLTQIFALVVNYVLLAVAAGVAVVVRASWVYLGCCQVRVAAVVLPWHCWRLGEREMGSWAARAKVNHVLLGARALDAVVVIIDLCQIALWPIIVNDIGVAVVHDIRVVMSDIHGLPLVEDVDVFQLWLLMFHIASAELVELRRIYHFLSKILLWAGGIDDAILLLIIHRTYSMMHLFELWFMNLLHEREVVCFWVSEAVEVFVLYLAWALQVSTWRNFKCVLSELVASTLPLAQINVLIFDSDVFFCDVVQISHLFICLWGAGRRWIDGWWIRPSRHRHLVHLSLLTFHWVLSLTERIGFESLVQLFQNVLFQ